MLLDLSKIPLTCWLVSFSTAGFNSWADARRGRVVEMAALLKAQPPEDYTDPHDEARIRKTVESLDDYNLTSSRKLAGTSL